MQLIDEGLGQYHLKHPAGHAWGRSVAVALGVSDMQEVTGDTQQRKLDNYFKCFFFIGVTIHTN